MLPVAQARDPGSLEGRPTPPRLQEESPLWGAVRGFTQGAGRDTGTVPWSHHYGEVMGPAS